jgi:hypothetical protein
MPSPIKQPNDRMAASYCIDLHSRSGYSGSPVFVYRMPGYDLEDRLEEKQLLLAGANYLGLLGIHFAQFPEKWQLISGLSNLAAEMSDVPLIQDGAYVKGLSGMTCVLPAWNILDVLNLPHLKEARDQDDAQTEERQAREGRSQPEPE